MFITHIELNNFRNHKHLSLDDLKDVILIVGKNAVGKTNIIEALQLLSMHESFRHPKNEELINNENRIKKEKRSKISVSLLDKEAPHIKQIEIEENKKTFLYDKKLRLSKDIIDILPSVLFTPDDLQIIKGSPEQRRDLLDSLGSRLSKTFSQIRNDFYKTLKQKNSLLKQEQVDINLLRAINKNLALLGSSLTKHRQGLCEQLLEEASIYYKNVSGGETLQGEYYISWKENTECSYSIDEESLYSSFSQREENEVAAKRSLIGPQKDDIIFTIENEDARRFASQGQQRSIALSIKMAEMEIIKRVKGKNPLLLLDDVMSELDSERREAFSKLMGEASQTIITTTNLGYFEEEFLKKATVIKIGE